MKSILMFVLLLIVSMGALGTMVGCEVTRQIDPNTSVTMNYRDAATLAHWLNHQFGGHDD